MATYPCVVGATFAHLELFLQKVAGLDVFDTLIFNYRLKSDLSQDHIVINFKNFVQEFSHQLQVIASDVQFSNEATIHQHLYNLQQVVLESSNHIPSDSEVQHFTIDHINNINTIESQTEPEFIETKFLAESTSIVDDHSFPSHTLLDNSLSSEECRPVTETIPKEKRKPAKPSTRRVPKVTSERVKVRANNIEEEKASEDVELPFFFCRECTLTYQSAEEFSKHSCNECGQTEATAWEEPATATATTRASSFVCSVCHEEYRSVERMAYHLARCRPGPYPCVICRKTFPFRNTLNQHKADRHRDKKCFKCEECGANFQRRTSLQKHQVNQHERPQRPTEFACPHCSARFDKRVQLTLHCIGRHSLEKTYLCQVCGIKFLTQGSLNAHMKVHTQPRQFTCAHCDKKFQQKEKLMFHTRIHTGERPHLCPTCGKGFIRKSKLDEHARRHRGERRFRCLECDKSYAGNWDLKLHTRKVHGEQANPPQKTEAAASESVFLLPEPSKEIQEQEQQVFLQMDGTTQQFFQVSAESALVFAKMQAFGSELVFS